MSASEALIVLESAESILETWHGAKLGSTGGPTHHRGLWEGPHEDFGAYLAAVDLVQQVIDTCRASHGADAVLDRALIIQSHAFHSLQDGFSSLLKSSSRQVTASEVHVMARRQATAAAGGKSSRSIAASSAAGGRGGGTGDMSSSRQSEEGAGEDSGFYNHQQQGGHHEMDDAPLLLMPAHIPLRLNAILTRLARAGAAEGSCADYLAIRKKALEGSMRALGRGQFGNQEVVLLEWSELERRIKEWMHFVKLSVRFLLLAERRLCEHTFEGIEDMAESCFADVARGSVEALFGFAESFAMGKRLPERLFSVLDMHEMMLSLQREFDMVFMGDGPCRGVRDEFQVVITRLGVAARAVLSEFENGIERDQSKVSDRGAVHGLTRYVVNYLILLYEYRDSLKRLFSDGGGGGGLVPQFMRMRGGGGEGRGRDGEDDEEEDETDVSSEQEGGEERDEGNGGEDADEEDDEDEEEEDPEWGGFAGEGDPKFASVAASIVWKLQVLTVNLDAKSKMMRDHALAEIFMMNNAHYIARKVKESDLRRLLGDDWIRSQALVVQQHANEYLRLTWGKLSHLLQEKHLAGGAYKRSALKDKFRAFSHMLDDILRTQASWVINPGPLRDELRSAIKYRVFTAYTEFYTRHSGQLLTSKNPRRYIKYDLVDLNEVLVDLFEGGPHTPR